MEGLPRKYTFVLAMGRCVGVNMCYLIWPEQQNNNQPGAGNPTSCCETVHYKCFITIRFLVWEEEKWNGKAGGVWIWGKLSSLWNLPFSYAYNIQKHNICNCMYTYILLCYIILYRRRPADTCKCSSCINQYQWLTNIGDNYF